VTEGADDQVLAQANSLFTRVSVELLVSQPSLTIDVAGAGLDWFSGHRPDSGDDPP
jgi:hypothetical protein